METECDQEDEAGGEVVGTKPRRGSSIVKVSMVGTRRLGGLKATKAFGRKCGGDTKLERWAWGHPLPAAQDRAADRCRVLQDPAQAQWLAGSAALLSGLLLFLLLPPLLFSRMEGWSYVESFYFAFITLSTVGFGDYVIGEWPSRPDLPDRPGSALSGVGVSCGWLGGPGAPLST